MFRAFDSKSQIKTHNLRNIGVNVPIHKSIGIVKVTQPVSSTDRSQNIVLTVGDVDLAMNETKPAILLSKIITYVFSESGFVSVSRPYHTCRQM